jgi:integrase
VDLPTIPHKESPWLHPNQLRQLLAGFFGHELEAWLLVSATLGLRREEGLALEWKDIDLRRGVVHITKGLQWVNGHELLVEPKTALSRRDLVLGPLVRRRLKEIKKETNPRGRLIGDLNPLQVARKYKSFCERNGLPYVPAMNLRTTWATNALKAKIDISIVAKCLGHSNIQTTAKYYLMRDLDVLKDASKIWETEILEGSGNWGFGRAA